MTLVDESDDPNVAIVVSPFATADRPEDGKSAIFLLLLPLLAWIL